MYNGIGICEGLLQSSIVRGDIDSMEFAILLLFSFCIWQIYLHYTGRCTAEEVQNITFCIDQCKHDQGSHLLVSPIQAVFCDMFANETCQSKMRRAAYTRA